MHTRLQVFALVSALFAAGCAADVDVGIEREPLATGDRYIVKVRDWASAVAAARGAGATIVLELRKHDAFAALIPSTATYGLSHHPAVEYLEIDPQRWPSAETVPYGIPMVEASLVTTASTDAKVKTCIIDSGLATTHADLSSLPITGESGTNWNVDGCGHGTHVAGTIAAVHDTAGVVGCAPSNVALHIVRVFGDDCRWAYASSLVAALDECEGQGARVVNMSLGGGLKSRAEEEAFQGAWSHGVLAVAAAGNDGSGRMSYPASYPSVVSVGAIDANRNIASFSQRNAEVDLVAPGVSVLSTVPWKTPTVDVDGATYHGQAIELAATGSASGALVNGGRCTSSGAWTGKVVLCERGDVSFSTKVAAVQSGGGLAALIYNNATGNFSGTLGAGNSSSIPAVSLSREDGLTLVAGALDKSASVVSPTGAGSGWESWNGTSMATPHVAGVAALVWSKNTSWTNQQVRDALERTALDLGLAGRDDTYGHGLVQAKKALDLLLAGGDGGGGACAPLGASCTADADCCSARCRGRGAAKVCK
ncbi:MAG: S8 family serine peptidase [Deltaproteobacteria bacterium]|nr:S8 family serine peptidase [Deltaproteobacteria bacterium]